MPNCHTINGAKFDHWVKAVIARCLRGQRTFFVITRLFVAYFATMQIHFSIRLSLNGFTDFFLKIDLYKFTILWLIGQIWPAACFCK